jgi:hypothetical protein
MWGPYCGDGIVQGPEECDHGAGNGQGSGVSGCTLSCRRYHYCGDGVVDPTVGDECDFGALNGQPQVPCNAACAVIQP